MSNDRHWHKFHVYWTISKLCMQYLHIHCNYLNTNPNTQQCVLICKVHCKPVFTKGNQGTLNVLARRTKEQKLCWGYWRKPEGQGEATVGGDGNLYLDTAIKETRMPYVLTDLFSDTIHYVSKSVKGHAELNTLALRKRSNWLTAVRLYTENSSTKHVWSWMWW